MSGRLVLGVAVLGTVLVLACAHGGFVPQPTPMDVQRVQPIDPGLTLSDMQAGRAAYLVRCSGCHPLHGPGEYRGDQWPSMVARMQKEKKVKIPEHDRLLMERYLVAFSSTAPKPADAGVSGPGTAQVEGTSQASVR